MRISDWSSDVCSSDLIVRRHHRIIGREAPFSAVVVWGLSIVRHQMAAKHLEFLSVFQTHDVVWLHRRTDRYGGHGLFFGHLDWLREARQSRMNIVYEDGKVCNRHEIGRAHV